MRKAWNGWLGLLHEETMSKKALLYVANREMARGWVSWHMRLAERASMRKSFVYLLNRELSQALGAWAEMAVERAELMRKWTCGVLRCATDGWAGAAAVSYTHLTLPTIYSV